MISADASETAFNSASQEDLEIDLCFFENQETGPPLILKTEPEVDNLVSQHPARSESEYPVKVFEFSAIV